MADNQIVIKLRIDDKGNLKKASSQTEKLSKSTDKATRSTDRLQKSRDKYNRTEKGVAQISSNSTKNFSKMQQSIGGDGGGGSGGLVRAYALLAANVFALTAAFGVLSRAAQVETLIQSIEQLEVTSGRSIKSVARDLQEASGGSLDFASSLRSVSLASSAGFGNEQIRQLGEVAKNASVALGRNLADGLDRIFRGVIKVEPELLDEIGLFVRVNDAAEKYADALGIAASDLTEFQKRQAFANEAITQGQEKFAAFAEVEPDAFSRIAASLTDMAQSALNFVNKGLVPIVDFLSKNKLFLGAAFGIVAVTLLRQVIPALGVFATSSREAAERAKKEFDDFQKKAGARLDAVSTNRINALKKDIAEAQKELKKFEESSATTPRFQSRAKGADQNLADLENKKLGAVRKREAVETRIGILKKAEGRASKANKDIITAELADLKVKKGLLDQEIIAEKEIAATKKGAQTELGGEFEIEQKKLNSRVTRTLAVENVSLTFAQNGLMASLRTLKAEIISTAAVNGGLIKSLFTLRGAAVAATGAFAVLTGAMAKFSRIAGPILLLGALLAPAFQALGKAMGFGSDEANRMKKAFSSVNELLENFEEKLANARSSLRNLNTTSLANLDALNAQNNALLDMAQALEEARISAIEFRTTANGFQRFFDDAGIFTLGFQDNKTEEAIEQAREAVIKMSTDFDNLNTSVRRIFQDNMSKEGFEQLKNSVEELTETETQLAEKREKRRKVELEFSKKRMKTDAEIEVHALAMQEINENIVDLEEEQIKRQEKVKEITDDNLTTQEKILNSLPFFVSSLKEQRDAGMSLKSALDGAAEAANTFNRQFIKKTQVDQALTSIRQISQSLENVNLGNKERNEAIDAIIKGENAVLKLLTNKQRQQIEELKNEKNKVIRQSIVRGILQDQAKLLAEIQIIEIRANEELAQQQNIRKTFANLAKQDTFAVQEQADAQKEILAIQSKQAKATSDLLSTQLDVTDERVKELQNMTETQLLAELNKDELAEKSEILNFIVALLKEERTLMNEQLEINTSALKVEREQAKISIERLKQREKLNKSLETSRKLVAETENLRAGRNRALTPSQAAKAERESYELSRKNREEELKLKKRLVEIDRDILIEELKIKLDIASIEANLLAMSMDANGKLTEGEKTRLDLFNKRVDLLKEASKVKIDILDTDNINDLTKVFNDALDNSNIFQRKDPQKQGLFGSIFGVTDTSKAQMEARQKAVGDIATKAGLDPSKIKNPEQLLKELEAIAAKGEEVSFNLTKLTADTNALILAQADAATRTIQGIFAGFEQEFKKYGPEGEFQAAILSTINTTIDALGVLASAGGDIQSKLAAASMVFSSIGQMIEAQGKARMAAVDKEIEAEKKRDGQSKKSLEKVKQMEQQKEMIGRKAFEKQKKMQLAAAALNIAASIIQTLGSPALPFPANVIMAGVVAAMGMKQLQLIKSQEYGGYTAPTDTGGAATPSNVSLGSRSNEVDVSRTANRGELAFLRGAAGSGSISNFTPTTAAAGRRGYAVGSQGVVVGERGPEVISPSVPVDITPNDQMGGRSTNVHFTIHAVDAAGLEQTIQSQRGNIIGMIREAANGYGENFLEQVDIDTLDTTGGSY